jgi:hypothetical protein
MDLLVSSTSDTTQQSHHKPSFVSWLYIARSKSEPSPNRLICIICLLSSNTEIPVPSKATRDGSFCDLNLKKTDDDMAN